MPKIVARTLYANNLSVLARAYRTAKERLGDLSTESIEKIDVTTLSHEQCGYLDISYATEQLLSRIDCLDAAEKSRLNESAGRFLDKINGHAPENSWPRFDPDFELSCTVRHLVIAHSQAAA